MFDKLRVKYLLRRMRKRRLSFDNFDQHKRDLEEVIEKIHPMISVLELEAMIEGVKNVTTLPDEIKADMIVTLKNYLHTHPIYQLLRRLEQE